MHIVERNFWMLVALIFLVVVGLLLWTIFKTRNSSDIPYMRFVVGCCAGVLVLLLLIVFSSAYSKLYSETPNICPNLDTKGNNKDSTPVPDLPIQPAKLDANAGVPTRDTTSNKSLRGGAMKYWLSTNFARPNSRSRGRVGTSPQTPQENIKKPGGISLLQLSMYENYVFSLRQKYVGVHYEPVLREANGKFHAFYRGNYVYLSGYIDSLRVSVPDKNIDFVVDTNIPPASGLTALLSYSSNTTLCKISIAPVSCNKTIITLNACELVLPAFFTVTYALQDSSVRDCKDNYNYCR